MATVTLVPNGTISADTGWSTNAATHHAGLSDGSDATRSAFSSGSPAAADLYVKLDMSTFAFPAGAVIQSVRPKWRVGKASGTDHGTLIFFLIDSTGSDNGLSRSFTAPLGITTEQRFAALTTAKNGSAWTQALIDSLTVWIDYEYSTAGPWSAEIYEVYVDVVYNAPPTVLAVTVSGQLREDVPVSWTYSDGEGDAQTSSQVKIFTAAVIAGGGFDPNTSTAVFDSGAVANSSPSYTADANLSPGHYSAYVRATDAGTGAWSAWAASSDFRILNSPLMML